MRNGSLLLGTVLGAIGVAVLSSLASDSPRTAEGLEDRGARVAGQMTFYALDFRQRTYDFSAKRFVHGYQVDGDLRYLPGDLDFDGRALRILNDYDYTGAIVDLGREDASNEFSNFYGLRYHQKRLQLREFPYGNRFVFLREFDNDGFFGRPSDDALQIDPQLGHTYLLRITHRTKIKDERFYVLRVLDLTPGAKLTMMWRPLEASAPRLAPRTNRDEF